MSFSDRYPIKFILPNVGEAKAELIRLHAPHLSEQFVRVLPVTARGLKREDFFIIPINQLYPIEKPIRNGKKGDLIYDAQSKSILILTKNTDFDTRVANIGKILTGLDVFEKIRLSSGVKIVLNK